MYHILTATSCEQLLHDCHVPEQGSIQSAIPIDCAAPPAPAMLNDCATPPSTLFLRDCATPPPALPRENTLPTLIYAHPALQSIPLDDEYAVVFVPSVSRIAVLNQAALRLLTQLPLAPAACSPDTYAALAALYACGVATASPTPTLAPPPESDSLVAWLHLTNACNLRCQYCYIRKSNEHMDEVTAYAAIDTVIRSAVQHGYQHIILKYAGGEPGLQLKLIALVHRYAQQEAQAHGLNLQAGMLTNGTTLTASAVQLLRELGIQITVSLDGGIAAHDALRPTLHHTGSFERVVAGIMTAMDHGLRPDIAVTVTAQNVGELPDLVAWLRDHDLRFSLSLYRDHQSGSGMAFQADEHRLIAGLRAAYAVLVERPPTWSVLGILLDRTDASAAHQRACAAGHNYLVIDQHGQIAQCQMMLDQPVATVATPDPLGVVRASSIGLRSIPVDQKQGCQICAWRYWCAGGCALATYRALGSYDRPSPNCAIYHALYPELIRLEGLRLRYWYARMQSHAHAA